MKQKSQIYQKEDPSTYSHHWSSQAYLWPLFSYMLTTTSPQARLLNKGSTLSDTWSCDQARFCLNSHSLPTCEAKEQSKCLCGWWRPTLAVPTLQMLKGEAVHPQVTDWHQDGKDMVFREHCWVILSSSTLGNCSYTRGLETTIKQCVQVEVLENSSKVLHVNDKLVL